MIKPYIQHTGKSIKRWRGFKGMTQQDLADAIGKTRSLVSHFERTGQINKYTLKEVADAMGLKVEELENIDEAGLRNAKEEAQSYTKTSNEELVVQLNNEIKYLRETIDRQWKLINDLSKSKPAE